MMPMRCKTVVWDEVDGEGVLCCENRHEVHVLNGTALHVWRLCDGEHTKNDIVESLTSTFTKTDGQNVGEDVERILSSFRDLGVLQNTEQ